MIKRHKKQYSKKKVHLSCISCHANIHHSLNHICSCCYHCTIFFFCSFPFYEFPYDTQKNNTLGIHIRWFMAVTWLFFFFVSYFFHFFSNLVYRTQHTEMYIPCLLCLWLFFMLISFFLFCSGGISSHTYAEKIERKRERKSNINDTNTCFISIYLSIYIYHDMWAWEQ